MKPSVKRLLLSLVVVLSSLSVLAPTVEAKRLGGGGTSGLRRQAPPPQPAQPVPARPAVTPAPVTPGLAPGAAPRRSWLGPIAGLAAGLGIAALMSHLGFGAEFGNLLTLLLFGVIAVLAVRFVMSRMRPAPARGGYAPAGMAMGMPGLAGRDPVAAPMPAFPRPGAIEPTYVASAPAAPALAAPQLPAGFDVPAFERIAKLIFIRMQAANDAGDLADLRQFATPEMFATFRLELQDRPAGAQATDVVHLEAEVLDFEQDAERQLVSVRFHGLIRETVDGPAAPFDETWHLVRPLDAGREWAIAGIAQNTFA